MTCDQFLLLVTRGSGNGTALLSSEYVRMPPGKEDAQLQVGVTVQARHPDKQDYLDATVINLYHFGAS